MKDYLAALANLRMETPREGTDKTIKTPPKGSSVSFVSDPPGRIREIEWPYLDAASEPRCPSCRRWWPIPGKTWGATGEQMADCTLHHFEVLAGDNCKRHAPQQGSALPRHQPRRTS